LLFAIAEILTAIITYRYIAIIYQPTNLLPMLSSKSLFRCGTALLLALSVAACGGGGGGGTATIATPTTKIYGQTDAKTVAGTGLLTSELLFAQVQIEQAFFGGFIQGFSTGVASGSASASTLSCVSAGLGSGTLTVSTTKAGVYVGLQTNDSVNITFNACDFGGNGLVLNGNTVLVSKGSYANLPINFSVLYSLTTTNFDMIFGGVKNRSNGVQNVAFNATVAGVAFPEVTSTVATSYSLESYSSSTAKVPAITFKLNTGTVVYAKYSSTNAFVSKLDGGVTGTPTTSGAVPLIISTPTPLAGTLTGGRPVPTVGVFRVKGVDLNLQTETTVQGISAVLKADSNGDGTLDLSFNTTYSAMTAF
jgi:hypothetical protein